MSEAPSVLGRRVIVDVDDSVGTGFAVGRPRKRHQHVPVECPSVSAQRLLEPPCAVLVFDHELKLSISSRPGEPVIRAASAPFMPARRSALSVVSSN